MDSEEFKYFRKRLSRTQKQIAVLLGTSLKAIHSYEQGWRTVPAHVRCYAPYFDLKLNSLGAFFPFTGEESFQFDNTSKASLKYPRHY